MSQRSLAYTLPSEGIVTIGREHDAMFRIDDGSVSRAHAELQVTPTLAIKDLGSTNGTTVAGRRAEPGRSIPLRVGDSFEVGSVTVVLLPVDWSVGSGAETASAGDTAGHARAITESAGAQEPVVADPAMLRLHGMASQAAATDISVLLLGETGSGKEILAEAVHRHSARRSRPFVRIHCAAVPENLLESELFGYDKGAFSGAVTAKPGLLESADGGTVLLDEIGDMSLALQAKLLRVLEDRKVMRLGSVRARSIDVRFIAATNRNLAAESRRGTFRMDLYYRLNGFCLQIPPLRARTAEIEPLAQMFMRRAAGPDRAPPELTPAARDRLLRHSWPGNVRELRNVIERAMILARATGAIAPEHLDLDLDGARAAGSGAADAVVAGDAGRDDERSRIVAALAACAGNQTHAARMLGISRGTLVSRLAEYGIPRPRKRIRHG